MNILYLNHYAGDLQLGMEYRPFLMAREWVRMGHQVTVVAAGFAHTRSRQPELNGAVTERWIEGVRYLYLSAPAYQGNGLGRVRNIFTFVGKLFGLHRHLGDFRPDAVIASSTYPLDIYPARRLARRYGAKLIWEVHDLWPLSPMELGGLSPRHPFIMLLQKGENDACRRADSVVCMLPKARDHLVAHGMSPDKFVFVPNGIGVADWAAEMRTPPPDSLLETIRAQRAAGRFVIGYAGSVGVANALDDLIRAAALLRDVPVAFVLIGQGPEKATLQRMASELRANNVHFCAPIPKTAIPDALAEMDALYIGWQRSSLYRFGINPNKLMDYMMAAKPVLHAVEAGNDPVQDAACGLSVAPADSAAIADAVRRLIALPQTEREAMGQRGQAFVRAHHDYPVLAGRFLAALQA